MVNKWASSIQFAGSAHIYWGGKAFAYDGLAEDRAAFIPHLGYVEVPGWGSKEIDTFLEQLW
jgi:hypothetical protein